MRKVKRTKSRAMIQRIRSAILGCLQVEFILLSCFVSQIYAIAAEMKKIEMFIQSGDFPMTPL